MNALCLSLTDESTAPLKNTIMPSPSYEYLWIRWNSTSATPNDNTHLQFALALWTNSAMVQDIFLIPSNPTSLLQHNRWNSCLPKSTKSARKKKKRSIRKLAWSECHYSKPPQEYKWLCWQTCWFYIFVLHCWATYRLISSCPHAAAGGGEINVASL